MVSWTGLEVNEIARRQGKLTASFQNIFLPSYRKMVLNGKKLAEKIKSRLAREIKKTGLRPGLASILVGNNPASALYISIKEREAKRIGIYFKKFHLKNIEKVKSKNPRARTSSVRSRQELKVIKLVSRLNHDSKIHGILVQLPLPKGLDAQKIINAIDPRKDVDGFHPENVKLLKIGKPRFVSPPHGAIIELLKEAQRIMNYELRIKDLNAVILANSKTFAEPLKILLEKNGIKTQIIYNLQLTKQADIIIVAKGKPKFVAANMIKRGAIVIDVGTSRVNNKLVGDVDFLPVAQKAGAITPVPGGVGPVTVAMLLKNTVTAARKQ